jgi:hypothetical protein
MGANGVLVQVLPQDGVMSEQSCELVVVDAAGFAGGSAAETAETDTAQIDVSRRTPGKRRAPAVGQSSYNPPF